MEGNGLIYCRTSQRFSNMCTKDSHLPCKSAQSDQSLFFSSRIASLAIQTAPRVESYQTAQMCRLNGIDARSTCLKVCFVTLWLMQCLRHIMVIGNHK